MPHNNIFNAANNKLHHDMETLLMSLLPFGKRAGQEYVALNPTRHDNKQGSFSVNLVSGKWSDFATGDSGGDVVSLYAYLKRVSQYEAAKEILGIKDANTTSFLPKALHSHKVNEKPLSNFIGDLWHECNVANDLVAKYLKQRDITCALPETIREHPSLYHKLNNSKYPAMVAAITIWPNKTIAGLHRTYLKHDGSDKASISPNKMMLGNIKGGAVRFAPPGRTLIIAEGIETALSVYLSTEISTWAALSTSGLLNVKVPPLNITQEIIIAADPDKAGLETANKLASRLLVSDYKVSIAIPPEGMDFNDLLKV